MELASLVQLDRCHRRHDEVMANLLEAARRLAAGRPDPGDVQSVHEAVAFFDRSITRHFLDEEGSVFPRLSTRRPELAADLAALSAEHPIQIALQTEIAAAAQQLDGEARPSAGMALLDAATRLADAHRAHVTREDEIFARAHDALTEADDIDIVAEMETRRDRDGGGRGHSAGGGRGGGGGGGDGGGGGGGGGGGRGHGGGGGGGGRTMSTRAPTIIASPNAIAKAAAKQKAKQSAAKQQTASKKLTTKSAAKSAKKPAATKSAAKKPAKNPAATKSAAKKPAKNPAATKPAAKPSKKSAATKSAAKKSAAKPSKKSAATKR